MNPEADRLEESRQRKRHWRKWGPYVSERQWGTVREDYSPNGTAWEYFPHDHARSRAYRWGEDGIAGICDRHQTICFAIALWNGHDAILKERLFGLSGNEGNHGEDVKEYYFYLDSTPTHSYMKCLYKYPQTAYPYEQLVQRRQRSEPEVELLDTGVFDSNRYFDVFVEYAKNGPEDICIRITAINRGPETARLILLPTLWFRNTWSWDERAEKPSLEAESPCVIRGEQSYIGVRKLFCEGAQELLFTENETNYERLYNSPNANRYAKDGINEYIVHGRRETVNPGRIGTKAAARYSFDLGSGATTLVRLRFADGERGFDDFDGIFADRIAEADEFYAPLADPGSSQDLRNVQRQGFAGMPWSKQS